MKNNRLGDFFGAFADGAVLFPLLAALTLRSDFSGAVLLATAGLAYLAAGVIFRVPMSVQPLKAVAIAAVASGAHQIEVRAAGALLGVSCLALTFVDADKWAARVPRALIHGLQLALGVILVMQGARAAGASFTEACGLLLAAGALVALTARTGFPWLGLIATGGLCYALFAPDLPSVPHAASAGGPLRWDMVLLLVLPQVVLTLANSVVGTIDVTRRYYGEAAKRVSARRLLQSIGVGNVISASIGGLPFCHGSGGVTAHYRGGARSVLSNFFIGAVLLALAAFGGRHGAALPYPPMLLGVLLAATGIFHWQLAAPTWAIPHERIRLALMAVVALWTQNMLAVLGVGLLPDLLMVARRRGSHA